MNHGTMTLAPPSAMALALAAMSETIASKFTDLTTSLRIRTHNATGLFDVGRDDTQSARLITDEQGAAMVDGQDDFQNTAAASVCSGSCSCDGAAFEAQKFDDGGSFDDAAMTWATFDGGGGDPGRFYT